MMSGSSTADLAKAVAPAFVLERAEAVPALIGRHEDFLIIAGLGGTACDVGAVTGDAAHVYSLGGAMGAACMMGLGLALARPDLGALATIGAINPPNLAILCVDNGHYGETGWQQSHTSLGVDLEKIAAGAGIRRTATVAVEADIAAAARLLREGNGSTFVSVRVKPNEPPSFRRNFDASFLRDRFRNTLLGHAGAE
jgi:hypothetical protein